MQCMTPCLVSATVKKFQLFIVFFRHFVNYWKISYISTDKNDPLRYNEQLKGCGRPAHVHKQ